MPVMKSIGGVRPCDVSGTRHTGSNLAHLYRRRRGLTSDVQSRKTRIPAAPPTCFPRDANYHAPRVLVLAENAEELKLLPPVQQNVRSDGPSAQARRVATYSIPLTGLSKHRPLLSSAVIGSMATQIHHSWCGACGCTLRLLRSMVPIFRSCLIEDDLMALTPHADGLFQFSI